MGLHEPAGFEPVEVGPPDNESAENKDQTRDPSCDPPGKFDKITDILRKIRKERERSVFVLVAGFIDTEICDEVYGWRKELREAGKNGLDILIHSPGGNLSPCYTVARLFSRCADSWEALVPEYAASGATLICLGSSNIVMPGIAQLGPVDPQVKSKRQEKFFELERQSPLEAFEAVRYLREFSLSSLDMTMEYLLDHNVTPARAVEIATKVAIHLVEPILAKIAPYDLGAFALDSRVAREYCSRVSNPTNPAKKTQRGVSPRTLVEKYPAHEFVIDLEEARALGFQVSEPAPGIDTLFDELRPHLPEITKYIGLIF